MDEHWVVQSKVTAARLDFVAGKRLRVFKSESRGYFTTAKHLDLTGTKNIQTKVSPVLMYYKRRFFIIPNTESKIKQNQNMVA